MGGPVLLIVGGNSFLRILEQCEGPMRARTSIGSSPTGRCSGLDKVPWRDLTLLDKLDIQALGLHHPSRGSAPTFFWFFDATINRRLAPPLLFSFSSHCRAFFGARGNMNGGRRKGARPQLEFQICLCRFQGRAGSPPKRDKPNMHHVEVSRRALTQTRRYLTLCTRPSDVECRFNFRMPPVCMTPSHASIIILTTRNPPTQMN